MADHNEELIEFDTFTLPFENGEEVEYAIIDTFDFEGREYVVVSEVNGEDVADELSLFYFEDLGDEVNVESIDDDEQFQKAVDYYESLLEDMDDEEE